MTNLKKYKMGTACVHGGVGMDQHGSVVPAIYQTSTFSFENAKQGADRFAGKVAGFIYSRMGNPTVLALEDAIAGLEGGHKAIATASGMAAVHLVFAAEVGAGDHVVCGSAVYGPTQGLLRGLWDKLGVQVDFVDAADLNALGAVCKSNTKLVFVETPGNPTLAVADIAEVAAVAREHNARVVVDNTFASPVLQTPIAWGADVVVHSLTKFINGHSDVVAGAVVLKNEEDYLKYRKFNNHIGGCIDPFNAFLVHRGMKTLALRMERHSENGYKVAKWLEAHPKIEWVSYPFLPSHPQYEIAKKQMSGGSGLIACEVKGGIENGSKLLDNVHLFGLAVSLGGVESLIQHPASMTHSGMSPQARSEAGISDGLIRLSVGIENVEDLIDDLDQALAKV